jgi:hypothetical protein
MIDKEREVLYEYDFSKTEVYEKMINKEIGIDENDYLNEEGYYKDYNGNKYNKDRNYLIFKKLYENMEPTKEYFYTLKNYYKEGSDYSFVKSPSLRHLLFDEPLPQSGKNDKYFNLLDIEIRMIMTELINLLSTNNQTLKKDVIEKINKIKETDYIFTEKESRETVILLLIDNKQF